MGAVRGLVGSGGDFRFHPDLRASVSERSKGGGRGVVGWAYGIGVRLDSDRLVVDEARVFAAVLVGQVHGIAGELHAAGLGALAEVGVVFAWYITQRYQYMYLFRVRLRVYRSVIVVWREAYGRSPTGGPG